MRTTSRRTHGLVAALALAVLATPGTAQEDSGPSLPWPAIQAGVRFGYDSGSNGTVAGAQMRIPVIRAGWIELVPAGDVTFLTGLKEYQFTGDVAVLSGGRRGGLYGAVGYAARNSIYEGPERETRTGPTVALGLTSRGFADVPIGTQIEVRWIFIDAPFDPQIITFGVNLPLWGWGERGRR